MLGLDEIRGDLYFYVMDRGSERSCQKLSSLCAQRRDVWDDDCGFTGTLLSDVVVFWTGRSDRIEVRMSYRGLQHH